MQFCSHKLNLSHAGWLQARAELQRTLQEERANNAAEKQRLQGATAAAEHLAQQSTGQVSATGVLWQQTAWTWCFAPWRVLHVHRVCQF
jgi:hypothetical protein